MPEKRLWQFSLEKEWHRRVMRRFQILKTLKSRVGKKPAFQLRTKLGSRVHSSDIGEAVKQQGPDIALELAWKSRNMDFAMPYLIQAGIIEGQLANNLHLFSVYWDFTKAIFC
jgi:hypothetical protein